MKRKIIEFIDKNSYVIYIFLAFCAGLVMDSIFK